MNTPNPQVIGFLALTAALMAMPALWLALRKTPRLEIQPHIWEEVINAHTVRVHCQHCTKSAAIIMPVPCEGAVIVREIFAGQHANCVAQPATFV